jgi:hypothetical protein
MSTRTYLAVVEFDMAGRASRSHAVATYDGEFWPGTACGLPNQPYPLTGARWDAVPPAERCTRCTAVT